MSSVTTLVQTATRDLTPTGSRLPPIAWSAFIAMNRVHGMWRWYRRVEVYTNPNNFAQLLAGHAANFLIGDSVLVRVAAQCVLIATRILECVEQQALVCESGKQWLQAVQGHYPSPYRSKCKWKAVWISPSTAAWWHETFFTLHDRMNRIFWCTINIVWQVFKLSMKIMDAVDVFSLSPETRNEGVNEFFVNSMKCMDVLVERKDQLLQSLIDNREVITKILKGSPVSYAHLLNAVENALNKTEAVHKHAQQVTEFGNGVLVDFGKRTLNGLFVAVGMSHNRPGFLAQPINASWMDPKEQNDQRYPE